MMAVCVSVRWWDLGAEGVESVAVHQPKIGEIHVPMPCHCWEHGSIAGTHGSFSAWGLLTGLESTSFREARSGRSSWNVVVVQLEAAIRYRYRCCVVPGWDFLRTEVPATVPGTT